jgi:hypothetical protein
MAGRTRKPKRSPEFLDLCLVSYRTQSGVIEQAAVTTAQRGMLFAIGRVVADHGLVPVGLPVPELNAALAELKASYTELAQTVQGSPKIKPWEPFVPGTPELGGARPDTRCTCTNREGLTAGRSYKSPTCPVHGGAR